MPRVPTYNIGGVQQQGLPSARLTGGASAEHFRSGSDRLVDAFGKAASTLGQAYIKKTIQDHKESELLKDKALARDKIRQARDESRTFMSEVYAKNGEEALDVAPMVEQKFGEIRKKYAKELSNVRQKDLFAASFDSLRGMHLDNAYKFQTQKRKEFEMITLDAESKSAVEDAVVGRNDSKIIDDAEFTVVANTARKFNGKSADVKTVAVRAAVHNLHSKVLEAKTLDSPEEGKVYLEENWDKFRPEIRDKMRQELEQKAEDEFIYNKADELSSAPLSLEEKLSEVDKIGDPTVARKVRRLVKDRYNEKEDLKKLARKQFMEAEVDKVWDDPHGYKIYPAKFSEKEQNKLYALKKKLIDDQLAKNGIGTPKDSDPRVFMDLMSTSIQDLRKKDLTDYIGKLDSSDFKKVFERQRRGDKGNPHMQQLKAAIKGWGDFDSKEEGDEASVRLSRLLGSFKTRLEAIPPKEQTPEKINEIIFNDLLQPVSHDPGWFSFEKEIYRFEIPYLEDKKERAAFRKENLPKPLQKLKDVNFHEETNRYYVDRGGVRYIYDSYGNPIKKYRKQNYSTGAW